VFWRIASDATINSNGTFVGTLIANGNVSLVGGVTVNGRIMALTGTLSTAGVTNISGPTCLIAVDGACGTASINAPASHAVYPYPGGPDTFTGLQLCSAGTLPSAQTLASTSSATVTWVCAGQNGGHDTGTNGIPACTATRAATATLTLVKTIVGGTRTFADFPLTATGLTTITGDSAAPAVTAATVIAGTYTLSETSQSDYTAGTWSCLNNATLPAVIGDSITLAPGDNAICTIQNTYITPAAPPGAGSGGNNYGISTPVAPLIDVVKIPSPLALPNGPGLVQYTYTVTNIGTVPMTNVTVVDNSCSPLVKVSGDASANVILHVNGTWTYTCSTTLSATHTNTVTATGWANGVSSIHIANATVVVGASIVPPLIHVTKVPSPLALPAGGGMVTYTKKVTNPGTVALSNVQIADDKCSPVKYISGDTNGNSLLDPTETWTYTCQINLTKTMTNTVTVSGQASGLTARDFAIATVIVVPPKFPNTSLPPRSLSVGVQGLDVVNLQTMLEQKGSLVIPAGIAKGFFGKLTRAAIIKYQASVGLPQVGVFGPMTRAKLFAN